MEITYDNKKNQSNKEKHGVYLSDAVNLDWDTLISRPDTRNDYGEFREIGLGYIDDRLYCVVFTQREESLRIISLRKANDREKKYYGENH